MIAVAGIMAAMRDGCRLAANLWLPDAHGSYPAVLLRTPYGNEAEDFVRLGLEAYVMAGYAVVFQSVRGRGCSEGSFGFFFVEGQDGFDSVEWVASQPWCNGQVAMDGGSYLGTAQWLAAREQPVHLVCVMPSVAAGDYFNEIPYTGGALNVDWAFSWLGSLVGQPYEFDSSGECNLERFRPLVEAQRVLGVSLPHYEDILRHSTLDSYWRRIYFGPEDFARIDVPSLSVTGWFDGDQAGALHYWEGMQKYSPAGSKAELIIGPWLHQQCYLGGSPKLGELNFSSSSVLPIRERRIAFLQEQVRGLARPRTPKAQTFVSGSNVWLEWPAYPPQQVQPQSWYLDSGGHANGAGGDGRLSAEHCRGPADRFHFDPRDPVPYRVGAEDHTELEARKDILVYTSAALDMPLTVLGPVTAELYIASTAPDTDFTAKLLDLQPDGRAISLTHTGGVLRARYRESFERQVPLRPGTPTQVRIRLCHVGHTFRPGHRLRVEISSSCFPLADPNPNTGEEIAGATVIQAAGQTVLHDKEHPSRLILSVLSNRYLERAAI